MVLEANYMGEFHPGIKLSPVNRDEIDPRLTHLWVKIYISI